MKKWLFVLVILIAMSALVVPAAAQTFRTEYEGVEYCGPMTGAKEWISGDRVGHARGGDVQCLDIVSDDRISGDAFITVNYNFQLADLPVMGYGPMWGKIRLENDGGYWSGSWVGERTKGEGFTYIRAVMQGHGNYEGLQARVTYVREHPDPSVPFQVQGVIMVPGGH